jgi:hypothetical protein
LAIVGEEEAKDKYWIKLLRMIRVFRLARASRIIRRLTDKWTIHTAYIEAAKFFMYATVIAHVLACLFWIWPGLFYEEGVEYTWRMQEDMDFGQNITYIHAIFWSITTSESFSCHSEPCLFFTISP